MRRRHWIAVTVLLLVGLVAFVLFPAIGRVRAEANRISCANNTYRLGLCLANYADTHGEFPSATLLNAELPPERRLSWYVPLLPYLEQTDSLLPQFDVTVAADHPRNSTVVANRFPNLVCPASGAYGSGIGSDRWKSPTPLTHYVGVAGIGTDAPRLEANHPRAGVFGYDRRTSRTPAGIPDGLSNTLLFIETGHEPGHWAFGGPATVRSVEPGASPYFGAGRPFGGFHSRGWVWLGNRRHITKAGMADGWTREFTDSIAPEVLDALATVGGKEALHSDW
jgi:hypothetical protein